MAASEVQGTPVYVEIVDSEQKRIFHNFDADGLDSLLREGQDRWR